MSSPTYPKNRVLKVPGEASTLNLSPELWLILKTFLAHKLTAVKQTKLKKNHVISSKNGEVMKVLVVVVVVFFGGETFLCL